MNDALSEKRKRFIINFVYFAIILLLAYFALKYAIFAVMPFVIAFLVSWALKPVIRFCTAKLKFSNKLASILLVILFYCTIGVLLVFVSIRLTSFLINVLGRIPGIYEEVLQPKLTEFAAGIDSYIAQLSPETAAAFEEAMANVVSAVFSFITQLSGGLLDFLTKLVGKTPSILLSVIITVISTFFITVDYKKVTGFLTKLIPKTMRPLMHDINTNIVSTVGKYIKSYGLIMLITFAEIFIGLLIVGIDNAALIALLIALFDILPVVGSGMVLLPWTIITFIQGNIWQGVGLGIVYLVVVIVRQIIEPKIVGEQVGLHPLIALMAMVVGTRLFGGIGLFILPITCALISGLHRQGKIRLFKDKDSAPADGGAEPVVPPESGDATET